MSSHYIYVQCSAEGCDAFESAYTGSIYLDRFSDDQWEGGTITALCREHEQEAKG
ncbi:hypothetical protein [Galactobacter valiniphilus]|uniref:hypothetical protein n=1 Tax=Galactobacter valiniphilus TaxID=2676122 RepID=UPI0013149CE1|nr:hypothetical protein [Galactobacter valiniphilus]